MIKRMNKEKVSSNVKKNIFFGFGGQFIMIALGIILPRLFLVSYGSETNGLVTTVSQIYTYVALLESGIGNAAVNAFYKPIIERDQFNISDVFSAAQIYFRKITRLYLFCALALTVLYPCFIKSQLSTFTVVAVVLLQGLTGVVNFYFAAAYRQLLVADGKNYILTNVKLFAYVLSSFTKIFLMVRGFHVVLVQALGLAVSCIETVLYIAYVKKQYPWLAFHKNAKIGRLSERNAFVVHELSTAIFTSTDAILLSTFCNLKVASVYAIYNMIFSQLNSLIQSVNNGLLYLLGHTYAEGDRDKYIRLHDFYDSFYMALVFTGFTVAYVLILPFVNIYTRGVSDIAYVDSFLPILFVLIQLLSCFRAVSSRLITIGGHAKATQNRSVLEAVINLAASIVLVNLIGIYGVLIGTIIALLYRTNDIIIYANRKILNRSPWKTYKKVLMNLSAFGVVAVAEWYFRDWLLSSCSNYGIFILYGFVTSLLLAAAYFGLAIITNRSMCKIVLQKMKR